MKYKLTTLDYFKNVKQPHGEILYSNQIILAGYYWHGQNFKICVTLKVNTIIWNQSYKCNMDIWKDGSICYKKHKLLLVSRSKSQKSVVI